MASAKPTLAEVYNDYIAALNTTPMPSLLPFVNENIIYNQSFLTRTAYEDLIKLHKDQIPDLQFDPTIVIASENTLAVRIEFNNVTPIDGYLGYGNPEGRSISFVEHVFYEFVDGKIEQVWSVVDEMGIKSALEAAAAQS